MFSISYYRFLDNLSMFFAPCLFHSRSLARSFNLYMCVHVVPIRREGIKFKIMRYPIVQFLRLTIVIIIVSRHSLPSLISYNHRKLFIFPAHKNRRKENFFIIVSASLYLRSLLEMSKSFLFCYSYVLKLLPDTRLLLRVFK